MQLTWKASESASAMHALHAAANGWVLAAHAAAEALAPLVTAPLPVEVNSLSTLSAVLLEQAAAGIEQNQALAERAVVKIQGREAASETAVSELAAWISSVERAYYDWHRSFSKTQLVDEIVTRSAPMRDLWDARGPGMLKEIGRITEPNLLAERADVVMVLPVLGGHGTAHLPTNGVTLEAVLTNADAALPEVVRLAWLLGQLQFDVPAIAEQVSADRRRHIAKVAMLAPVLAAAEEVELAALSQAGMAHAAQCWRVASSPDEAALIADVSWRWWATYQAGRVAWPVAVVALEQMLAAN